MPTLQKGHVNSPCPERSQSQNLWSHSTCSIFCSGPWRVASAAFQNFNSTTPRHERTMTRWCKVIFHPLVGGHLTIEKGHLTIPKRSQRIARELIFKFWENNSARPQSVPKQSFRGQSQLDCTIFRSSQENELDFAYWSINGEKRFNESETYGLLQVSSGRGGCGVVLVAGVGGRSFFFNGKEHRLPKRWGKLQTWNDWNI